MNFNFCLTVFHFDHLSNSIVFNMLTPDDLCYAEFFTLRAGGWEFHPFFGNGQRLPTLISLRSPTQRWRGCFDGCAGSIIWESAPCSSNRPFLLQTFLVTTKTSASPQVGWIQLRRTCPDFAIRRDRRKVCPAELFILWHLFIWFIPCALFWRDCEFFVLIKPFNVAT